MPLQMVVATLRRVARSSERWLWLLVLLAGAFAWLAVVQDDPFFWDTVQLGSKHAHFFHDNGLRWLVLPQAIDSGHPPVFGYYLAWMWWWLGKTLAVSHWAMLPFVTGSVVLLFRLGERIGGSGRYGAGLVLLAAADPVLAAQSGLVGPDMALFFFFLLAVWSLWGRRPWWAAAGVFGLCAVSLRGMMTAVGLLLWQLYLRGSAGVGKGSPGKEEFFSRQTLLEGEAGAMQLAAYVRGFYRWVLGLKPGSLRCGWVFLPGFAFALWFLWWHRQAAGWTGFHAGSPWAPAFEPARGVEALRNAVVLGWRWADFGRLFEWFGLIALWSALPKGRRWAAMHPWLALLFCLLLVLSPSALFYQNLSAHRYFLPGFGALHLLVWQGICTAPMADVRRWAIAAGVVLGLASGNFWLYPHGVAMGWDATLAHRPYHALRAAAVQFLEKEGISLERVGTAFPNRNTGEHLLLDGDNRLWAAFDPKTNECALISNVFNDVSPQDRAYLRQHRRLLWRAQKRGVWIEIYGW